MGAFVTCLWHFLFDFIFHNCPGKWLMGFFCSWVYYDNVICQPSLFAHINSRYHAFKSEVLKDSHCETAQFWARYMDMIQMVFTLIRATRKTTLYCMSALSVCLVPKVHCTQSQQLRTICTWVTDHTHNLSDTHHRCKNFNKIGLVCHNHWFFAWEMLLT